MSVLDAAATVLAEAGGPLHCREITQRILDRRLWTSRAATPEKTVRGQLATDINDLGERSRFRRVKPGLFRLSDTAEHPYPLPGMPESAETGAAHSSRHSLADAAEFILRHHARKQPMHHLDITSKALDLRLVTRGGLTTANALLEQIVGEIARNRDRGEVSRFSEAGDGRFGLTRWLGPETIREQRTLMSAARRDLHERLLEMPPADFETLVGSLFARLGFEDFTTSRQRGAVDVRGTLVAAGGLVVVPMLIRVRRSRRSVPAPVIRDLRVSLGTTERGAVIATGDFSAEARAVAAAEGVEPIALMTGKDFLTLLVQHEIGIHRDGHGMLAPGDLLPG